MKHKVLVHSTSIMTVSEYFYYTVLSVYSSPPALYGFRCCVQKYACLYVQRP